MTTRLYLMRAGEHELFREVEVNAVEGHALVTIRNAQGQFLSAHENRKHVGWTDRVYGCTEYFSYDLDTERLVTFRGTCVWFDGAELWQYRPKRSEELEDSLLLVGAVANRSDREFNNVCNNNKATSRTRKSYKSV